MDKSIELSIYDTIQTLRNTSNGQQCRLRFYFYKRTRLNLHSETSQHIKTDRIRTQQSKQSTFEHNKGNSPHSNITKDIAHIRHTTKPTTAHILHTTKPTTAHIQTEQSNQPTFEHKISKQLTSKLIQAKSLHSNIIKETAYIKTQQSK